MTRYSRWVVSAALAVLVIGGHPSAQAPAPAPDPLAAVRATYDRARALIVSGDALGSRPLLEEVIAAATKAGDKQLLQRALGAMSSVYSQLADWPAVLDYARRSYEVLPEPNGRAHAVYLARAGRVYQELRDRDAAMAAYDEAIAIARKLPDDGLLLSGLLNETGLVAWRLERNRELSLQRYEEALAISRRLKDHEGMRVVLNNSGNVYRGAEMWDEAERRYAEGLATAARDGMQDAMLMKNMGIVLRETNRPAEAERILLQAMAVADAKGNARTQWQSRQELGILLRESDPARAADYFEATLGSLEAQHSNVLLDGFSAGALSGAITIQDDPYELYIDLLLKNARERDAFVVAERARARAFLDTLSVAREQVAAVLPPDFVAEERTTLEKISTLQTQLRTGTVTAEKRRELVAAVAAEEEKLTALRVRLATDHPALAHARYPHLLKLDDIQQSLLGPDTALLEYFVGAQSGTLWVVTRDHVEVRRLPARRDVEASVRALLASLGTPTGDYRTAAAALTAQVLPDVQTLAGGKSRLLIVPHGILNYVPFETLLTREGRFVVEGHRVSYAPSASSLAFLRGRAATGTGVLALGNPVMGTAGEASERGLAFGRADLLKPLPYSGTEVRALSAVYGSAARVLEQQAASEEALGDASLAQAGIIHFATHGLLDEERPERSGLALSAVPPRSDGILQVREVFRLHLNAALVTLSACETALGKEVTGEGVVGLSRAFFYAGANAVLASLWNVNDASTVQLMTPLYAALADGRPLDEALQAAKVTLIRGGGSLSHPYYWAPFVVSGHATAGIPVRPGWHLSRVLIGVSACLVLVAAVLVVRRRVR